jgi:hypothetical protein
MEQVGLTLMEALKHYSKVDLWREYEDLQKYRLIITWVDGPENPDEEKHWRLLHIEQQLQQELQNKLVRGELVASAYEYPVSVTSKRVEVPRDKWTFLEPDFNKSAATAAGLQLVEVRIVAAKRTPEPLRGRKTEAQSKRAEIHAAWNRKALANETRSQIAGSSPPYPASRNRGERYA